MKKTFLTLLLLGALFPVLAEDNVLTKREKKEGWILLFDGTTTRGWMTSAGKPSLREPEEHALNPHKSGHYMLVHEKMWTNYTLSLDFKISKGCNSGVFFKVYSLTSRPGRDVGFNGLEMAIDDTSGAGYHDTGAIYDLVKPSKNAMKPVGEWNHLELTCRGSRVEVVLNGEKVTEADLSEFQEKNKRPDGTGHKFDVAYRDHPQAGYIGLQDHGSDCWYKNIKIRPY